MRTPAERLSSILFEQQHGVDLQYGWEKRKGDHSFWTSTELNDYLKWPGVGQDFRIERAIWHEKHHGYTRHIVYGLTSLSPEQASSKKLLTLAHQ